MVEKEIRGVKDLASYVSGKKCDFLIESYETKVKLKNISRFHDEIVEKVHRDLMRKHPNVKCINEFKIEFEGIKIPGRIDLFCIDYDDKNVYVIEVKSYSISKFDIRDCYQLLYYVKSLMTNKQFAGYKFIPWLVYRLHKKYIIIDLLKLTSKNLPLIKTYYTSNLVPNYWCKYCSRKNCPFYKGVNI